MNIPDTIKVLATTTDTTEIRKLENDIARMFISPLLLVASIVSFVCRYFILHETLLIISIDSIIILFSAIVLELLSRKLKSERLKEILITSLFSFIIIFVWLRFSHIVGPGVWIFALSLLLVTIFREQHIMTLIIAITIITLIIFTLFTYNDMNPSTNLAYIGQTVLILVLIVNLLFIRQVIVVRSNLLTKQYTYTLREEKKFRTTLKSVGDCVITVNQEGAIELVNPIAQHLIGLSDDEAIGIPFDHVFKIIKEYTREEIQSPIDLVFNQKKIIDLRNHTLLLSNTGFETPIEYTAAPIIYEDGNISGVVLVFRDVSEQKEKQKHIEFLSYHDQLTGLYNRRFFDEKIMCLDEKRNLPFSMIYADVNGLKIINDAFGHESGDQIIIRTANVFKTFCRTDDLIARVGGDEYVIVLPKTNSEDVETLVTRLEEEIHEITINDIHVSISFGWDTKYKESQSTIDVLKSAEDMMYQKKVLSSSSKRNGIIKSILNTLHVKSPREEAHSKRVSLICKKIGMAYHLSRDDISELGIAGELHDIGKIAVDEQILNKPGKLSDSEWAQIKKHPEIGYRLLGATSEFNQLAEYVLAHHERWDGLGYPKGLKKEEINWKARVISLADAYDVMTSDRPYRNALGREEAIAEIKRNAGSQFDPNIAKVFIENVLDSGW